MNRLKRVAGGINETRTLWWSLRPLLYAIQHMIHIFWMHITTYPVSACTSLVRFMNETSLRTWLHSKAELYSVLPNMRRCSPHFSIPLLVLQLPWISSVTSSICSVNQSNMLIQLSRQKEQKENKLTLYRTMVKVPCWQTRNSQCKRRRGRASKLTPFHSNELSD